MPGIPESIEQIDLERTVLKVFDKIDAPVDPQNIEAVGYPEGLTTLSLSGVACNQTGN